MGDKRDRPARLSLTGRPRVYVTRSPGRRRHHVLGSRGKLRWCLFLATAAHGGGPVGFGKPHLVGLRDQVDSWSFGTAVMG